MISNITMEKRDLLFSLLPVENFMPKLVEDHQKIHNHTVYYLKQLTRDIDPENFASSQDFINALMAAIAVIIEYLFSIILEMVEDFAERADLFCQMREHVIHFTDKIDITKL
jgi:uncharacterized protein with HEPN domain